MNKLAIAAFAASVQLAAVGMAQAADTATGTMNGVNHGTGATKARCTPGDPNVLVNQKAKTFVMDTKAKAPMKGSSADASMGGPDAMSAGSKSAMVSMCKSEAMSMGAKMSSGGMKKTGM